MDPDPHIRVILAFISAWLEEPLSDPWKVNQVRIQMYSYFFFLITITMSNSSTSPTPDIK